MIILLADKAAWLTVVCLQTRPERRAVCLEPLFHASSRILPISPGMAVCGGFSWNVFPRPPLSQGIISPINKGDPFKNSEVFHPQVRFLK